MEIINSNQLSPSTRAFYCDVIQLLQEKEVPFLVGGAYAFAVYTGIERHTKDIDLFVRPRDKEWVLDLLAEAGFSTETTSPHWLAKAHNGDDFIDVIFSGGNGIAEVDDQWFERAVDGELLGLTIKLCPPEEIIWSKSFVMERERFDGADITHLIRARGDTMDWQHLLARFDGHWPVLFAHLMLFHFIYPSDRTVVPRWLMEALMERLKEDLDRPPAAEPVCRGTLLSRAQYLIDIEQWGYQDARLSSPVNMKQEDVEQWTDAIDEETKATTGLQQNTINGNLE